MSKPKKKTPRISGASIPSCDPEDLVLVMDENGPHGELYDDRVHLPVSEALVLNILEHGVIEPAKVLRDGNLLYVIDGRQRVKATREANRRLKADKCKPILIRYVAQRAVGVKALGIMASTFIRQEDTPSSRAKKMQKHVEMGQSEAQVARDFGVSVATVRSHLALLDAAPAVQRAVNHGELPATVAKTLTRLPRAEQGAALAKLKEEGATKGKRALAAAARVTGDGASEKTHKPSMLGAKAIAGIAKRLRSHPFDGGYTPSVAAAMVLDYVMGKSADSRTTTRGMPRGRGRSRRGRRTARGRSRTA